MKSMKSIIGSGIRLIDSINNSFIVGDMNTVEYSKEALKQTLVVLNALNNDLTLEQKKKLQIGNFLLKRMK